MAFDPDTIATQQKAVQGSLKGRLDPDTFSPGQPLIPDPDKMLSLTLKQAYFSPETLDRSKIVPDPCLHPQKFHVSDTMEYQRVASQMSLNSDSVVVYMLLEVPDNDKVHRTKTSRQMLPVINGDSDQGRPQTQLLLFLDSDVVVVQVTKLALGKLDNDRRNPPKIYLASDRLSLVVIQHRPEADSDMQLLGQQFHDNDKVDLPVVALLLPPTTDSDRVCLPG